MPELPEVETIVRDLSNCLPDKTFSDIIVHDDFVLRQKVGDLIRRLRDKTIDQISRRGKAVIMHLSSGEFLVIQLMMTGQLVINGPEDKHTRITFSFSDGNKLLYNDQRRFGQIRVTESLNRIRYFNVLGPEPFSKEFNPAMMQEAFRRTKRPIKNLLLDHTFVAGIGNIYACEILFRSCVSPKRRACRIRQEETKILYRCIVKVLREAIVHRGSSMRNYRDGAGQKGRFHERLAVYHRQGLACPRCHYLVRRIVQAGRSTFFCGKCQK